MKDAHITEGDTLPNEVKIDLHMLGAPMLNGVRRHVDGADVVAIHQCCLAQRRVQLRQKLA